MHDTDAQSGWRQRARRSFGELLSQLTPFGGARADEMALARQNWWRALM
jgi:hypothetical protein